MLDAVPDLREILRRGDPTLLAGIYTDFKVTATYEKATRQLTLEATVDAALTPDAETKRPPQGRPSLMFGIAGAGCGRISPTAATASSKCEISRSGGQSGALGAAVQRTGNPSSRPRFTPNGHRSRTRPPSAAPLGAAEPVASHTVSNRSPGNLQWSRPHSTPSERQRWGDSRRPPARRERSCGAAAPTGASRRSASA